MVAFGLAAHHLLGLVFEERNSGVSRDGLDRSWGTLARSTAALLSQRRIISRKPQPIRT